MKYLETVIECGLFSKISKTDYILAFESLIVTGKSYEKDTILFREGEIIDRIGIVAKGSVREEKTYLQGDVHILQVYDKNAIVGLEVAASRKKTAISEFVCSEDAEIVWILFETLKKSKWKKEMIESLLQYLADDNVRKINKVSILACKGLRERILLYLEVQKKRTVGNCIHIKMNREQLAQFLCVSRSALSNELNKMKKEGILDFQKNDFYLKK
ncbi:MAG: Crp/Fnr family transcriptional regulator [Schaedlerella sp.]|nr:Crp/Fnr family transcriptional regulator [Schaedlerella sp.]